MNTLISSSNEEARIMKAAPMKNGHKKRHTKNLYGFDKEEYLELEEKKKEFKKLRKKKAKARTHKQKFAN